jgi:hypothetical protein
MLSSLPQPIGGIVVAVVLNLSTGPHRARSKPDPLDPAAEALALAVSADSRKEAWGHVALLLRAIADDPDVEAVLLMFQARVGELGPLVLYSPETVATVRDALGRAIRKIMAEGGPEITNPALVLSALSGGGCAPIHVIPSYKDGQPIGEAA